MTVERSKRRSYFLSLVFITKCFTKNLLTYEKTSFTEYAGRSFTNDFSEAFGTFEKQAPAL